LAEVGKFIIGQPERKIKEKEGEIVNYTCEICTDYIDPSKTEEILKNVTRIITAAVKRAEAEKSKEDKQNG
jgi:hypothetical protein